MSHTFMDLLDQFISNNVATVAKPVGFGTQCKHSF